MGLQNEKTCNDGEVHLLTDHRPLPLPVLDYSSRQGTDTPIVIDGGAWQWRAGWAGQDQPALAFRSVLAKTRREKGRESELLVGSDISNIEAVRHALKSPYDRDVVTHYETFERLFDHAFSKLGLDSEGRSVVRLLKLSPQLKKIKTCLCVRESRRLSGSRMLYA